MNTAIKTNIALTEVSAPHHILQSVPTALNNGKISEAVEHFDDNFTFKDQALGLEFTDKRRLSEFFQRSRELFPDTAVEVTSTFEHRGRIVAEWKLTATETVSYWIQLRVPISLSGISIAQIESGRITHWSDYDDEKTSRRVSLASSFADWIDY